MIEKRKETQYAVSEARPLGLLVLADGGRDILCLLVVCSLRNLGSSFLTIEECRRLLERETLGLNNDYGKTVSERS